MERNQNGYPNGNSPMPIPNGNVQMPNPNGNPQGRTRWDGTREGAPRDGIRGRTSCDGSFECMDGMPIGYAYVPIQRFRMLYSAERALSHGTLFEELYLPFGVYEK